METHSKNAFAATVGRLGELSESELQQLYLIVGVRLGIPGNAAAAPSTQPQKGSKPSGKAKQTGKTSASQSSSSKRGNPARKSQWANHPLYKEHSRLKKVVEAQAKESKLSFNAVDTAESRAYKQAFTQWVEAKSSFRDRNTDEKEGSDEESDEESASGAAVKPATDTAGKPAPLDTSKASAASSGSDQSGRTPVTPFPGGAKEKAAKQSSPPTGKGKTKA